MIVTRSPLSLTFIGDSRFSNTISTTIDKYFYTVINRTPLIDNISARYSISETVKDPKKLKNNYLRHALLEMGIKNKIEIGLFANLPSKVNLGSGSSFATALVLGLHAFQKKSYKKRDLVQIAHKIESLALDSPLGEHPHSTSVLGGFFNLSFGKKLSVKPININFKKKAKSPRSPSPLLPHRS